MHEHGTVTTPIPSSYFLVSSHLWNCTQNSNLHHTFRVLNKYIMCWDAHEDWIYILLVTFEFWLQFVMGCLDVKFCLFKILHKSNQDSKKDDQRSPKCLETLLMAIVYNLSKMIKYTIEIQKSEIYVNYGISCFPNTPFIISNRLFETKANITMSDKRYV
jgi:hypothetical protein